MKQLSIFLLILCFYWQTISAQDPMYSQFYAAPLQLNPALTGLSSAPTIHLNYRNQWAAIDNAYATYAASYSQYATAARSGFGLLLQTDIAGNGIYNTTQISGFYAYDIRFTDDFYIRTGLEAGFVSKRINWDKLIFFDQINPESGAYDPSGNLNPTAEGRISNSINYFDAGAGMLAKARYWYAGFSAKHLNTPNEAFYNTNNVNGELPMRLTLHAGGEIPLQDAKKLKYKNYAFISPNVLYVKQREFNQLVLGAYAQQGNFFGGFWFRHTFGNSDAVIASVGFQKSIFKLGYSYDLTVSKLTPASAGSHEISLSFNFMDKSKKTNYNDCTKIFR
jgi:type IX secretion system PorP/SprF family membrane protein